MPDIPFARVRLAVCRHGWLIAIAVLYLYVFPYYPRLQSANELPRLYLVTSIVDDHSFAIDRGVARWGPTSDLASHGNHYYANKAPGASFAAVPVYAVVRWTLGEPSLAATMWLCRVCAGIIPSLAFLWLLYRFLARYVPQPEIRRLTLVAYALGSLALPYSLLYYSHQLSAACIGSAWIFALDAADRRRGLGAMALAGFLAGCAPLVDYQAAFAGIPVAVHALARMRRAKFSTAESIRAVSLAAVGAALPIAALLYYHAVCFGSPFATGYDYALTYGADHDHGLLGMTVPTWKAFFGSFIAPDNGLLALSPWWLLAIPGGVALWRGGERGTVAVAAVVALAFTYFISSIGFWRAGWEVGPRYLTAMLPFQLPLVCAALAQLHRRPAWLGVASGAIVGSVIIYVMAAVTLPYWPDSFRNPLYGVTFRLVGDGAFAPSVGRLVGISDSIASAIYVASAIWLVGWAIKRASHGRGALLAVAIGAAFIASFALAPPDPPAARRSYLQTLLPAVTE